MYSEVTSTPNNASATSRGSPPSMLAPVGHHPSYPLRGRSLSDIDDLCAARGRNFASSDYESELAERLLDNLYVRLVCHNAPLFRVARICTSRCRRN